MASILLDEGRSKNQLEVRTGRLLTTQHFLHSLRVCGLDLAILDEALLGEFGGLHLAVEHELHTLERFLVLGRGGLQHSLVVLNALVAWVSSTWMRQRQQATALVTALIALSSVGC